MKAQKNIKTALDELAAEKSAEAKYQAQKDKRILPHEKTYLEAVKPIEDEFAPKLNRVRERIAALEKQIEFEMLSTQTADGGLKLTRVENENFIVEANATSRREVDAWAFFEAVEQNKKDSQPLRRLNEIGKSLLKGKSEKGEK